METVGDAIHAHDEREATGGAVRMKDHERPRLDDHAARFGLGFGHWGA